VVQAEDHNERGAEIIVIGTVKGDHNRHRCKLLFLNAIQTFVIAVIVVIGGH
jgi:hypothetical protein